MSHLRLSPVAHSLQWLAGSVYRFPRLWFYPQLILFGICVYYTVTQLQFSTRRNDLVGADKHYHRQFLAFQNEFGAQDDLVAVIESEDLEKNRQFVERLGVRLESETGLFTDVFYKGDLKMLGPKALFFLDEPTLAELEAALARFSPFIQGFAGTTNLSSLIAHINRRFRTASREATPDNQSLVGALPAIQRILDQARDSLQRPGTPPSPGINALFGAGEQAEKEMYITFARGQIYLVTARARTRELTGDAVERMRALIQATRLEVPGVNVGLTGEPVLEIDEMAQSQRDTLVATVVSLALVALIFVYGYRETGRPLKAMFALVIGIGYTMGYTTLVIGHLNILTITFVPILIGLAIDFGVHLITRYEEEIREGRSRRMALEKSMVHTGQGIFTGCLTTAAAFFAMAATDFKGIQEMGLISGGGLIICLVPMLTLLPVLLLRGRQNRLDHQLAPAVERRARLEKWWLERPRTVVAITAVVTGLCLTQLPRVFFDYNLLNMQSRGLPAVVFEHKLIDSAGKSVLFAAVVCDSLPEAAALQQRIERLPTVDSVESVARFLAEDPTPKLGRISRIKGITRGFQFGEIDPAKVDLKDLIQNVSFLQGYLGLAADEVRSSGTDPALLQKLLDLRQSIARLIQDLAIADPAAAALKLAAFQRGLFADIRDTFQALRNQDDSGPLRIQDLPDAFRNRFIGRTGKVLLQVFPKGDVWQRTPQEQFVAELRQVFPAVTGTPVQLLEYTTLLRTSYETAALYALAAIAIMVFLQFRDLASVFLALLPVGLGTLWVLGVMGWSGIPFNPANIMTLPLVVGIGVTNGIHILTRFTEEQTPAILAKSTGKAVLVSGLTTIAGFGSLILAKHQGITSLGFLMAAGTTTCMIAALTFLPSVLTLLRRRPSQPAQRPAADPPPKTDS